MKEVTVTKFEPGDPIKEPDDMAHVIDSSATGSSVELPQPEENENVVIIHTDPYLMALSVVVESDDGELVTHEMDFGRPVSVDGVDVRREFRFDAESFANASIISADSYHGSTDLDSLCIEYRQESMIQRLRTRLRKWWQKKRIRSIWLPDP